MIIDYSLYLVADFDLMPAELLMEKIKLAVKSGVTCVQIRAKNSRQSEIAYWAEQLLLWLKSRKIPLIVNDHVSIAAKIGADGVHLGQGDMHYKAAKKALSDEQIIGLSIETVEQAMLCKNFALDYFGVGPVYPTISKKNAAKAIGLKKLKEIVSILPKPVVAIGGINQYCIVDVMKCGVEGVACISAILLAENIGSTTQFMKSKSLGV